MSWERVASRDRKPSAPYSKLLTHLLTRSFASISFLSEAVIMMVTAYLAASAGVPWRAKFVIAWTNFRSCGISFEYFAANDAHAFRLSTAPGSLTLFAFGTSSWSDVQISWT